MTARVGRDLAWPPHYAISPSRRNFPAFWWDTSVDSTVCNPPVGGEQWAPIRRMGVSATARFVPLSLPSPEKDRYFLTTTCNSVIKYTTERRIENRKYLRRRRSRLSRWRCSLGFSFEQVSDIERPVRVKEIRRIVISDMKTDCRGEKSILFELPRIRCVQVVRQHNQPLIQELISQESDEALTADRADYRAHWFRPSASDGSTSRSAKTYLRRNCMFSSMSCASPEQQRTAL
jgi:hypothetical protein